MSLQEHKLTDYAVSIAGLPDKIENKAQWLKQQFDARTDSEVRDRHNSLIDALDKDLAGRPTNESMAGAIDEKVVELVRQQHEKAAQILMENRAKLDELSRHLYQRETITGEEFMQILNAV